MHGKGENCVADPIELDDADLQPIEGEEAPVEKGKSLDDVISKALDGMDTAEDQSASDRARDEKGRFAPKDSETAAAPEGTSDEQPQVPSTEQTQQNAQPEISEGHFRGWTPEQRAAFQALPPEAQKVALDVVQGRDKFYGEKLAEYDQSLRAISPLVNAVQPHLGRIQNITRDPSEYVAHVLNMDYKLQFAPYAEKVQLLSELAQKVGVPIAVQPPDPFSTDPTQVGGEAYPVIHDLQNQVRQLTSQVQSFQQRNESALQQQTQSEVLRFSSQTNADGSPKYPLFQQVKRSMGELLNAGKANTMEEAYAIAVKPIEDAIQARIAAQSKAADAASQAALERARKARPVKVTGMAPGGKTKGGGLDAIIGGALDRAGFN